MGAIVTDRRRTGLLLALFLIASLFSARESNLVVAEAQTPTRPNFVFILTDDQRWDTVGRCTGGFDGNDLNAGSASCMPQVQQRLMRNGITFKRGYVTTSVCCPSRASIFTGQYARHTRVTDNGAYQRFNESSTIATWLDAAGYRTAHLGKYMNGYGDPLTTPPLHVPPGWDSWHVLWNGNSNMGYRNYTLIEKTEGSGPTLTTYDNQLSTSQELCAPGNYYSTDNWCLKALQFLRADTSAPFYLQFSATSPHLPAQQARRHINRYQTLPTPVYPNYNARPSPNPPSWISATPLASTTLTLYQREFRAALEANLAVDEVVGRLYDELQSDGRLANTVFVFMSDNGLARAEHRYQDKGCAYEECHKVPFVIACPPAVCPGGQADVVDDDHFALNIDLAPTIAELAGVTPGLVTDGRSLVPLLNGQNPEWRTRFLLEDHGSYSINQPLGIVEEMADGHTYKYVKYQRVATDFELYDLTVDPWELNNLSRDGVHTAIENTLAARLNSMFTPPVLGFTSAPSGTVARNDVTFNWSSDEHARFECSLDSTTLGPCGSGTTGSASFDGLSLSMHTFRVRATDDDNNISNTLQRTFTPARDTTPPPVPNLTTTPTDPSGPDGTFAFTSEATATFTCSLDGAPYSSCPSPYNFSGLAPGAHTFSVRAHDTANNVSAPTTYDWNVDVGTPDPPTLTSQPGAVSSTETRFAFTHPNNVQFRCSLDGAAFAPCSSPQDLEGLAEGDHTFSVQARNGAGAESDPVTVTWTVVDTTPPDAPSLADTPPDPSNADVSFAFDHDDAVDFACSLDGAEPEPCSSPVTYELAGGPHTFAVTAADAAGNTSVAATYEWTVDTTPPDPPAFTDAPDGVSDTATRFAFTSEAGATFECALDDGAFSDCTSPLDLDSLAVGEHTFRVRATDGVGNTSEAATHSWTVEDLTPVEAPIIEGFPADPSRGTATFSFRHTEPGITFRCAIDDAALADCSSPVTYEGLAEGTRTFSVVAVDGIGRTSDPATFTWTVDLTAPAPPNIVRTALTQNSSSVQLDFTSEPGATFRCALDAAPLQPCTPPQVYTGLSTGPHSFSATATDAAGNTSGVATAHWVTDNTPPVVTLNGNDNTLGTTMVAAVWTGSDADSMIDRYEVYQRIGTRGEQTLAATLPRTTTTYQPASFIPGATYCFQIWGYDTAGNVGKSLEKCRSVAYDDRSSAIAYSPGTSQTNVSGPMNNTLTVLDASGEEATFAFTGRRVGILARQGPSSGIAEVRLDGAFVANVDFYFASQRDRVFVWQTQVGDAPHTMTVRFTGTRNAASTGTSLSLDGVGAITQGAPVVAGVAQLR